MMTVPRLSISLVQVCMLLTVPRLCPVLAAQSQYDYNQTAVANDSAQPVKYSMFLVSASHGHDSAQAVKCQFVEALYPCY